MSGRGSSASPSTPTQSTSTRREAPVAARLRRTKHEYKSLGGELVPALDIRLRTLDGTWQPETPALIDSGADVSTFPAGWAPSLGVTLDASCCEEKKAVTAGGPATVWAYSPGLKVLIDGAEHHLKAEFCEGLDLPLLGRRDFFMKYRVSFDQRTESFTLEPYPTPPV